MSNFSRNATFETLSVTQLIDRDRLTAFQYKTFFLCALIVLLDGIDYQVIGVAAPLIAKELVIPKHLTAILFSSGALGAAVGGLTCGLLADRFGRKRVLVTTTLLSAIGTLLTVVALNITDLAILRFATGVGLGGAVPCFIALTSEYAPSTRRATIVSMLWAAFPLGGMVGGFVNALLLEDARWRLLFYVWGITTALVGVLLLFALPESVQFMLLRGRDQRDVKKVAAQLLGRPIQGDTHIVSEDERAPGIPLKYLFTDHRWFATLALWLIFFIQLGALTFVATWTPTLLGPMGLTSPQTALIVASNGLGSFIGTSSAGRLMQKVGILGCVVPALLLGAICIALFGDSDFHFFSFMCVSFACGVALGLSSSSSIAICSLIYPTAIRSSGIGWAMGLGRLGAVTGPLAIAFMATHGFSVQQMFEVVAGTVLVAIPGIGSVAYYMQRYGAIYPNRELRSGSEAPERSR